MKKVVLDTNVIISALDPRQGWGTIRILLLPFRSTASINLSSLTQYREEFYLSYSCLEFTRMCFKKVLAILLKSVSTRFNHEPCFGV